MQYFRVVNTTKKEVVCPWCLGDSDSPEWSTNVLGAVCLLQQARTKDGALDDDRGFGIFVDPAVEAEFETAMRSGIPKIRRKIAMDKDLMAGHWAGDEVYLVSSADREEYQQSFDYRNISQELATAWNEVIGDPDMQLTYRPDCECSPVAKANA